MSEEYLRCYAEISIENIRHNLLQARSRIPEDTKLLVVLKANAYGHGVENIAKSLLDVADYYAVATVNEALELREDGSGVLGIFDQAIALTLDTEKMLAFSEGKTLPFFYLDGRLRVQAGTQFMIFERRF